MLNGVLLVAIIATWMLKVTYLLKLYKSIYIQQYEDNFVQQYNKYVPTT